MEINAGHFVLLTAAIAAGGAGGYFYRDARGDATKREAPPTAHPASAAAGDSASAGVYAEATPPASASSLAARAEAPSCDDSAGSPGDCPVAIGPTDEGVCNGGSNWAARRCVDFKAAFKPKVAEAAVACLRKLSRAEACDQRRVELCGHEALMVACQDPVPDSHENVTTTNVASAPALASKPDTIAAQCEGVVKGCAGSGIGASFADCSRTLSGMNAQGRAKAVECMKTHCGDKGLVGCEAAGPFSVTPALK